MVFDHLSRKQVNVSLKALSLKSRITSAPAASTSKCSSVKDSSSSSSSSSSSIVSQAIITEASTKPAMIANYLFFKWHSRSKRAELINSNGFGQRRLDAQKSSEFMGDSSNIIGLSSGNPSSYSNAFDKYENHSAGDNCTDPSTEEESKYNFLSRTEGNDRGQSKRISIPSPHNQRPLSTATIFRDSSVSLGGAGREVEESDCIQLDTMISPFLTTSRAAGISRKSSQHDDVNALSIPLSAKSFSRNNNNKNNNGAAAAGELQLSCSSSSKRSNETKPSSLSSLPFTLESSTITFTTSSLLVNNIRDSCELPTSIWTSACNNTNRNVNANSSRTSSSLYSPSNEIQSSHSTIVNTFPCNYYAPSEEPADLSFNTRQRNKRKAKCRVRAGNKTVTPSESPSQSCTSVPDRWISSSVAVAGAITEKLPRQSKTKRSYLNYMRKFRQFRYNLTLGGSSTKVNKKQKNKLSLRKVGDLLSQSQLKGKVGDNPKETWRMESKERNNNNCCEIHISKHPAIKITVSPDTPDIENVPNTQQSVDVDLVTNSVARNTLMGNFIDNNAFSVEDFARLDFPNCVDFGITDFLCCKDEVDVDLSSDTDTSFLEATPPHRFSDSELEQIEAMSITLDTALNLNSKIDSLFINHKEGHEDKKTISAPPEMESVEAQEILDRDFILALKQMQANNLIKNRTGTTNSDVPPRKVLPKPFRRHISLPATIFMSYIFDQGNKTGASSIDLNKIQRKERLPKIDSLSCGSTENIYDGSSFSNESIESVSDSGDWVSKANSSVDLEHDDFENQAFTSELEHRSLIVRHMRKLIRQDTSGNFAPPDFCI